MHIKRLLYVLLFTLISLKAKNHLTKENFETLTRPLTFTRAGVETFFREQFNTPDYTEYIMPSHFGHLAHFLHYSSTLSEPYEFVFTIFDIFHTRMKDAHWVNALSFSLLLEQLPKYVQTLCVYDEKKDLQKRIQEILYKQFLSRFTKFSQNPMDGINSFDTFLATIDEVVHPTAHEISELMITTKTSQQQNDLQNIITRFIESALEKVVWNPKTQQDSWDSVCLLAEQIKALHDCGIISSTKTVNQLYWGLLYRYGYFLRSTKEILSPATFEYIKNSIANNHYPWLNGTEVEEFLTPKREYLKYILWECIADLEAKNIR